MSISIGGSPGSIRGLRQRDCGFHSKRSDSIPPPPRLICIVASPTNRSRNTTRPSPTLMKVSDSIRTRRPPMQTAVKLSSKGKVDRAIADFDQAIWLHPKDVRLLQLFGLGVEGRIRQSDRRALTKQYGSILSTTNPSSAGDWPCAIRKSTTRRSPIFTRRYESIPGPDRGMPTAGSGPPARREIPRRQTGRRLGDESMRVDELERAISLETLAAACAETGNFDSAMKWQAKANELDDDEEASPTARHLKLYQEKKPFRDDDSERDLSPP